MTPEAFIAKWRGSELKERAAAQEHFIDLCRLLDEPTPAEADPAGAWYAFEHGATKTTGGEGWADVWKLGHFAWEYKSPGKSLTAAYAQLQQYAPALDNPPLLVVCDLVHFEIHTNWTNSVSRVHRLDLEDLRDAKRRRLLKWVLSDPEQLRPDRTRQALTEEAAGEFAQLAKRLRERGHDPRQVAHFVNRLVFCMFAEDVGLLGERMFAKMLEASFARPDRFEEHAASLFGAMREGGRVGFDPIEWFNGGLFDDDSALPLTRPDIQAIMRAARLDWGDIDPSIFGTLFERGLDPDKRSQLGAHYTDRDKIMLLVEPVVVRPWREDWRATLAEIADLAEKRDAATQPARRTRLHNQAQALYDRFLERLRAFRVLDPACGSGNFLFIALQELKNLEHRASLDAERLGLERFGLDGRMPGIGPEVVKGIEINPYAAELARVTVWIGEIQWMRRNGFDVARQPILKPLDTIECRDAILDPDGGEPEWPEADVVVGNPPFLGDKRMRDVLGDDYVETLRKRYAERVPGGADLVTYWFAKAWTLIEQGKAQRAGLVATNSIRGGANRKVLLPIVENGAIVEAWDDEPWVVEGAAVRVSLVCFAKSAEGQRVTLDGAPVERIHADLTAGNTDLTQAQILAENQDICFEGVKKYGPFDIDGPQARDWLQQPRNPNGRPNSDILRPLLNAWDLVRRSSDKWVIDFHGLTLDQAALYEAPFDHVAKHVKPIRATDRNERTRTNWWLFERSRPPLRQHLAKLKRYIATPVVAKYRIFVFLPTSVLVANLADAIARDDDTTFGILHSRFHERWALRMGTSLEDRPRYTPTTTFETFPFPEGLTPDIPAADYADDPRAQAIAAAAKRLNEWREAWLNPPDLVARVPEVVPGYPDRLVPVDEKAARELKKRTLTRLYNERPAWLDHAHRDLDAAVAAAYDWPADIPDEDALARLMKLNEARSGK